MRVVGAFSFNKSGIVAEISQLDPDYTPSGASEGVGITYINDRLGISNIQQVWAVLESLGMGKNSRYWKKHDRKSDAI